MAVAWYAASAVHHISWLTPAAAGVIVLTRCGSRSAGVACGCWLILFGIIAKVRHLVELPA